MKEFKIRVNDHRNFFSGKEFTEWCGDEQKYHEEFSDFTQRKYHQKSRTNFELK